MDTANPREPNYTPEAVLISQRVVPYLYSLGYQYLNSNFRISVNNGSNIADVVAYLDQEKLRPYIIVEIKQKLPDELTLLDPAIQQAFSFAVILGSSVRYLLITDGSRYYWFERSDGEQAIVRLNEAPKAVQETGQQSRLTQTLFPVTDPEQFMDVMQSAVQALFREGVGFGLRMGIEITGFLLQKFGVEKFLN